MVPLILSAFRFEDFFAIDAGLPLGKGPRGGVLVFVELLRSLRPTGELGMIELLSTMRPGRMLVRGELFTIMPPDGVLAVSDTILSLQGEKN